VLDLDQNRQGVEPKDAATLVIVRDSAAGLEVFCVERSKGSRFMGGAIVFPGGKLDASDADPGWDDLVTAPRGARPGFVDGDARLRALAIAACRESLEEAAILPLAGGTATNDELLALRADLKTSPDALRAFLRARGLRLDLDALHPFARWITPVAESRRFDARFFAVVAPEGHAGAHDEHETVKSFWATPSDVLARFAKNEVQLMPPTHRTIAILARCTDTRGVLALAAGACLEPICPKLVPHEDAKGQTLALVLPGDPEHDVREARVSGPSRYVLRGEQWLSEDAPR
jgi:8-oxo-dGTP pyrophosphatase MutT (NUDIX family)